MIVNFTGNTASNTTVSSVSSISGLLVGQAVSGAGISAGTTIAAISGTTLTLSAAATATASDVSLTATVVGFTAVSAARIMDASGNVLAAGRVTLFPVNNYGKPISAIAGGGGGMIQQTGVVFLVAYGAITTDLYGGAPRIADTALTTPINICYRISVTDGTGAQVQGPGYGLQQPTGATFNLDTTLPNQPMQATIQTGPEGPVGPVGPVGATGPTGATGAGGTNGTTGSTGATGAAGSQGSVTALASASLPSFVGRNLFDISKITAEFAPGVTDGTLISSVPNNATGLMYCPGATSMVSNLPVDGGNWGVEAMCLYDANGAFISALPTSGFSNVVNGHTIVGGTAWALPGTQVYVRLCYVPSWGNQSDKGWVSDAIGQIYATIAGTATLLGYQLPGLDTVADVNAKLATAFSNLGSMLSVFEQAILPGNNRNAFDSTKAIPDSFPNADGTINTDVTHTASWKTGTVFCPGATSFVTNIPIEPLTGDNNPHVCTYDVSGNFLADITASLAAQSLSFRRCQPSVTYTLPGDQAYIKFGIFPGSWANPWPSSIAGCVFYSGTVASPPPVLTQFNSWLPFPGVAPVSIKTATQLGCQAYQPVALTQDCSVILNAFLATASATNPIKLILDGVFLIFSELLISAAGYTTIEGIGWGTGLHVIGGNTNGLGCSINVGGFQGGNALGDGYPTRTATNIAFRNFTVWSDSGLHSQFIIVSCSNVIVENIQFTAAAPANYDFFLQIGNANQIFVRGCTFTSGGTSHDGVHILGHSEDITISDCYFSTGDDAIALNAPEGFTGDISRVTITNCRFNGSLTLMRVFTSGGSSNSISKVRDVVVSNCTGWVTGFVFNLGIGYEGGGSASNPDQIQDFSVSNCTLSGPARFAWLGTPCGSIAFRGIKFIPTGTEAAIIVNFVVGELTLDDFTILRNPDGNAAPAAFVQILDNTSAGSIDRLFMRHCRVVDELGTSYAPIPCLLDLRLATNLVRLEAIDLTHVTALTSSGAGWTNVTKLLGNGVLGTGTQVPDSVMDSNALYLSSDASGAPSIKVGGVAKRLMLD